MIQSVPLIPLLLAWGSLSQAGEVKPKYGPEATRITRSHDYFRSARAPDFWVLSPYYAAQYNGRACSVASITMVVNAARASLDLTADDKLALQEEVLEKAGISAWKRFIKSGAGKSPSLEMIADAARKAMMAFGFKSAKVEMVRVDQEDAASLKRLTALLEKNEGSADDFMILNFLQGTYTGDADVGHVAPVGAYDASQERVLIMDVDREWYEPYWVPVATVLKGMATRDSVTGKNRGYIRIVPGPASSG